ncbi:MAG: hypothetical protein U0174_04905 [Polyangiaceae bacterium]
MNRLRFSDTDLTFEADAECSFADLEAACAKHALDLSFTAEGAHQTLGEWVEHGMPGAANSFADPVAQTLVGLVGTLHDGTQVTLRPCPRRAAGPDLRALFVGQRGLFGRIHRVWLYVGPRKAQNPRTQAPPYTEPLSSAEQDLRARLAREFAPRLPPKETP